MEFRDGVWGEILLAVVWECYILAAFRLLVYLLFIKYFRGKYPFLPVTPKVNKLNSINFIKWMGLKFASLECN